MEVRNRNLRLYFISETDSDYHLRVYSTQNRTGTIVLRYKDETLTSRGDSSGEDCNSNIFFVNCHIKSEGAAVSGKINVDDGPGSRWNVGLQTMRPTRDDEGRYASGYYEVDAYKTYLRKGSAYDIRAASTGDGRLSLSIDNNHVPAKTAISDGGATLCLEFTPEWTGSFYFKVDSSNKTNETTGNPTTSIGTYSISYPSN